MARTKNTARVTVGSTPPQLPSDTANENEPNPIHKPPQTNVASLLTFALLAVDKIFGHTSHDRPAGQGLQGLKTMGVPAATILTAECLTGVVATRMERLDEEEGNSTEEYDFDNDDWFSDGEDLSSDEDEHDDYTPLYGVCTYTPTGGGAPQVVCRIRC